MPIQILMPALSPTMTEGKLTKWLKNEGDKVKAGQVIAEIETDKATMEVEAVDEGVIGKILVAAGTEGVAVNTPIAVLLEEGESSADVIPAKAGIPTQPKAKPASDMAPPSCRPEDPAAARLCNDVDGEKDPTPVPLPRSPSAKRCAMRWPKKCAATAKFSSWARKWPNIRALIK